MNFSLILPLVATLYKCMHMRAYPNNSAHIIYVYVVVYVFYQYDQKILTKIQEFIYTHKNTMTHIKNLSTVLIMQRVLILQFKNVNSLFYLLPLFI